MSQCRWDPSKHGGKPCPVHGAGGNAGTGGHRIRINNGKYEMKLSDDSDWEEVSSEEYNDLREGGYQEFDETDDSDFDFDEEDVNESEEPEQSEEFIIEHVADSYAGEDRYKFWKENEKKYGRQIADKINDELDARQFGDEDENNIEKGLTNEGRKLMIDANKAGFGDNYDPMTGNIGLSDKDLVNKKDTIKQWLNEHSDYKLVKDKSGDQAAWLTTDVYEDDEIINVNDMSKDKNDTNYDSYKNHMNDYVQITEGLMSDFEEDIKSDDSLNDKQKEELLNDLHQIPLKDETIWKDKKPQTRVNPEDFENARFYPTESRMDGNRWVGRYHSIHDAFNGDNKDDFGDGKFKPVGDYKGASIYQLPDGYYSINPRITSMSFKTKEALQNYLDHEYDDDYRTYDFNDKGYQEFRKTKDGFDEEGPDAYKRVRESAKNNSENEMISRYQKIREALGDNADETIEWLFNHLSRLNDYKKGK